MPHRDREKYLAYQAMYRKSHIDKQKKRESGLRYYHLNGGKEKSKEYRERNREKIRERRKASYDYESRRVAHIMKKYGITIDTFDQMLLSQGSVCFICQNPEIEKRQLSVDHDHETGKVRALLCQRCNKGIGLLYDNPSTLRRAAEYIESFR